MGMQIAKRLCDNGFTVLAWNRSEAPRQEFEKFTSTKKKSCQAYSSIDDLASHMKTEPRIFWLMLPSETVEDFLFSKELLGGVLKKGDIVIDGGNSFYKNSQARAKKLAEIGVEFFDVGVSGGVWGYKNGFAAAALALAGEVVDPEETRKLAKLAWMESRMDAYAGCFRFEDRSDACALKAWVNPVSQARKKNGWLLSTQARHKTITTQLQS
jgi:6-phosphogluconate dehydrogenase (decarboxylating)